MITDRSVLRKTVTAIYYLITKRSNDACIFCLPNKTDRSQLLYRHNVLLGIDGITYPIQFRFTLRPKNLTLGNHVHLDYIKPTDTHEPMASRLHGIVTMCEIFLMVSRNSSLRFYCGRDQNNIVSSFVIVSCKNLAYTYLCSKSIILQIQAECFFE